MLITKIFTFEAAHKLPNYPGKCSELHGHAWKLMIGIKGDIDKDNGMIIDFLEIENIINKKVIDKLDHTCINDIIENPTCENIILWIAKELEGVKGLAKITVYENDSSFCELEI